MNEYKKSIEIEGSLFLEVTYRTVFEVIDLLIVGILLQVAWWGDLASNLLCRPVI